MNKSRCEIGFRISKRCVKLEIFEQENQLNHLIEKPVLKDSKVKIRKIQRSLSSPYPTIWLKEQSRDTWDISLGAE